MFTVGGTSKLNGVMKVRFANDLKMRTKILQRNKHTDIQLIELPTAMDKDATVAYLATHEDFQGTEAQAVFAEWATKRAPKEPKQRKAKAETTATQETAPAASKRKSKKAKTEAVAA